VLLSDQRPGRGALPDPELVMPLMPCPPLEFWPVPDVAEPAVPAPEAGVPGPAAPALPGRPAVLPGEPVAGAEPAGAAP
jgi:hypothetical protein